VQVIVIFVRLVLFLWVVNRIAQSVLPVLFNLRQVKHFVKHVKLDHLHRTPRIVLSVIQADFNLIVGKGHVAHVRLENINLILVSHFV